MNQAVRASDLTVAALDNISRQIKQHTFQLDGINVVAVRIAAKSKEQPLSAKVCIMQPEDLMNFIVLGGGPAFWLKQYAKSFTVCHNIKLDGMTHQVALPRFISGAAKDKIVKYQNGQPLDLRRDNLVLAPAGFRSNSPKNPRALLRAHSSVRLFPQWDMAAYLVRPERLDMSDPFKVSLV